MKLIAIAAIAAAGVALSGCASIVTGSSQKVTVNTPPTTGADCTLTSSEGTWNVSSPGTVSISKTKHDVNVHCTKAGYQDADAAVPSGFQAWTLGNLILGGIPGLVIDLATGATNEYPSEITVPMTQKTAAAPEQAPAPVASNAQPSS
jgi:uncharacterized protein YceK